jgi:hypothetical protein
LPSAGRRRPPALTRRSSRPRSCRRIGPARLRARPSRIRPPSTRRSPQAVRAVPSVPSSWRKAADGLLTRAVQNMAIAAPARRVRDLATASAIHTARASTRFVADRPRDYAVAVEATPRRDAATTGRQRL